MSHCCPIDQLEMPCFYNAGLSVGWKWFGIHFQFHFHFVIQFCIWPWRLLINMIPYKHDTWSNNSFRRKHHLNQFEKFATFWDSKVGCLYCTVHFTKLKIGISNVLALIRMLTILFCVAKEMFRCSFSFEF